jgi:two-component system cell cycle sensor histidine kinase/response regulator CckA
MVANSENHDGKRREEEGAIHTDNVVPATATVDQAIREGEEKYRKLLQTLTDAFLIFDVTTGLFVEANEAAQKLYGYAREEFLKLHHLDITAEREESAVTIKRIIKGEIGQVPLRYHKRKDGTTFPADIMTSTIIVGGHTLVYGIIKDITERMQAKEVIEKGNKLLEQLVAQRTEALIASEARNRFLSEGTFEGILVHDNSMIIDCNSSFAKMFGCEPSELIGTNGLELIAPESREIVARHIQTERPEPYEVIAVRKDGSTFPLEIRAKMIDYNGRKVRFASCHDITERKQAQDALRKANEELELRVLERTNALRLQLAMLENVAEGIFLIGLDDNIIKWTNDKFERMFGYDHGEMIGMHVDRVNARTEQTPAETRISIVDVLRATGNWSGEILNIKKDDTPFWCHVNVSLFDHPVYGRVMVSVHTDIDARKRAEDELAARERTLRTLIDSVPYNTMLLDTDGVILSINDAMRKRIGKRQKNLIGTDIRNHVTPEVFKRRRSWTQHVITSGKPIHYEDEINGRLFSHSQFPVFGSDGIVIGVVVFEDDITQGRKAEEELGLYREKMARAEQLATVGTMSAMVAHQLNQPLTVIRLLVQDVQESLKSGKFNETIAERLIKTLNAVDKANDITKNFLHRSRPLTINQHQSLNLMDIAERAVKFLSEAARRAGIQLILDASLNDIGELVGNPTDFEQLFFILIENAIHAAEDKKDGGLRISGGIQDQQVKLTFDDTCGGIRSEHIDQLFEPFFTTKAPDKGTGLGLSIVKRIVESYGGSVKVESRHGHGTIFYITMPLAMLK